MSRAVTEIPRDDGDGKGGGGGRSVCGMAVEGGRAGWVRGGLVRQDCS